MRNNGLTFVVTCSLALLPMQAFAHRLNVFAYSQADQVCVEASFQGGRPAMNSDVKFINKAGQVFLSAKTSEDGKVCMALPAGFEPSPLTVIVNAGEGHENRWTLNKEDFSQFIGEKKDASVTLVPPDSAKKPVERNSDQDPKIYSQKQLDEAIRKTREDAELNYIAPLRKQLAEASQPKITWKDIFGGIGWLVGLGGLFAWITTRKPKNK